MVQEGPGGVHRSDVPDGRRRADGDCGRDLDAGGREASRWVAKLMLAARVEKLLEVRVRGLSSGAAVWRELCDHIFRFVHRMGIGCMPLMF